VPTMASASQSRFHEDLHDDESILDDDLIEADAGEYASFSRFSLDFMSSALLCLPELLRCTDAS
jgi:hypothetical protein